MDSNTNVLYSAAGLPALISTGITFIYFLLKACHYLVHAISHETEGRVATAMPGSGEQKYCTETGIQGHTEVHEQVSGDSTEQYGRGTQRSPGSIFVPRRRQDVRLSSHGDAPEYTEESTFQQNAKRLQGGRHRNSQEYNGKGPSDPYVNPTGVFTKCRSRDNASDGQSSNDEGNGRKCDFEQPDKVFDDGVSGYRMSGTAQNFTTTKTQVTHIALQTDSCDTLYITKNALTAYTIAIVQNAQALQYDQMHVALQMARNQASLETPLRVEELMTAHFNRPHMKQMLTKPRMPRSLKPLILMQNRLPQLRMRRPTLRYPVTVSLQIVIKRSNTLLDQSPQPVEETTDSLMEYRQVTKLMTLGTVILILMSTHTCTT